VILLIVFPCIGVFIYLISQGRRMAERRNQQAEQARDELRRVVGFSVADELDKLERLKNSNVISNDEYTRLRARTYSNRRRSSIRVAGSPRIDDWDTGHSLGIGGSSQLRRVRSISNHLQRPKYGRSRN
jgi:hypothetical protein